MDQKTEKLFLSRKKPEGISFLVNMVNGVPVVIFLLVLVYLWSSSHSIISTTNLNLQSSAAQFQPNQLISVSNSIVDNSHQQLISSYSKDEGEQDGSLVLLQNLKTFSSKTGFAEKRDKEYQMAVKTIEEQGKIHRSWKSDHQNNDSSSSCAGKEIYVYDMPTKFNQDLLRECSNITPWINLCKYFTNDAMGEPIHELGKCWYNTYQYTLEVIFHSRILRHRCRVYDQTEAKLFYIPFYGGLDMMRFQYNEFNVSSEVKDRLGLEMVEWLKLQRAWNKNSGKDHVLVLSTNSWDFRRIEGSIWGTRLLELEEMQNTIKVMIERKLWELNDIGVPFPTHFHPNSDDDITLWQQSVISSNRNSLVSFAGAARPRDPKNIRSILINQCINSTAGQDKCRFFNCKSSASTACEKPESVIQLFMESEFCLQPPGDSPTRKSVFDSLVSGCIPVLFDPFTAYYQYSWHLPEDHEKYSVFIDQEDVRSVNLNVVERLMKVTLKEREEMRRYIVYELMPGLVYGGQDAHFDKFQDAFTITMNNLIARVTQLN